MKGASSSPINSSQDQIFTTETRKKMIVEDSSEPNRRRKWIKKGAQEEPEDKTHGIRRISHAIAPVAR